MTFEQFRDHAQAVFDAIPPEYRDGVDGLEVSRKTVMHPNLPEIFTLGECLSEHYPSEFGGAGEVRSVVALYYGSFLELSRRSEEWDWEDEIWETVTHEVRHHLESLASEDALEVQDYVEDQNFARREGETFDPFFFRSAPRLPSGAHQVDGDVFLEREVDRDERGPLDLWWEERSYRVAVPDPLGDVHYLRLEGLEPERGDLLLVLVRRRGFLGWMGGLLSGRPLEVLHSATAPVEMPE